MPRLARKTAVITGSSSGIGAAIAYTFATAGAHVVINYKNTTDKANRLVEKITKSGGKALAIQADISKPQEVQTLIETAQKTLGHIDIWVNNAGADILTNTNKTLDTTEKLNLLIENDLRGTISCCWGIVPIMQQMGKGNIINMSWDLAIHGYSGGLVGSNPQIFATVKAGIHGFSQSLAKTVAPLIRVNTLAPGWIATEFAQSTMPSDYYQKRIDEIPLQRFGQPEDVAHAALYLASDEADYITGQTIQINGGLV